MVMSPQDKMTEAVSYVYGTYYSKQMQCKHTRVDTIHLIVYV